MQRMAWSLTLLIENQCVESIGLLEHGTLESGCWFVVVILVWRGVQVERFEMTTA